MVGFPKPSPDQTPPDGVKEQGTSAIQAFIQETNHIWRLIAGVYSNVMRDVAADQEILDEDSKEDFYKKLDKHSEKNDLTNKIITELIICRIVDNFQVYATQLLELVFKSRKETLLAASDGSKGAKIVELDLKTLFTFKTMDELFNHLVEKKISSLTYKSIDEFSSFFVDKLGFNLFENEVQKSVVNKTIQARNIFIHNRGLIDRQFVSRTGAMEEHIGQVLSLAASDVMKMHLFIAHVAKSTDDRAVAKFALPIINFKAEKQ